MRIKFEELEAAPSSKEIDRNQILYYQKTSSEFFKLIVHDLHLY